MRAFILLGVLITASARSVDAAGGINLAWGQSCWRDNPVSLMSFACDANAGSLTMTASFAPTIAMTLGSFSGQVDLQSDSSTLPDWWQLTSPGGCRSGAFALGQPSP